ncbi:hypothetical protein AXY43_16025 [Clostridium sp. MF28]|uniref:hypothetical protein n=1 Tax=Clostridium TaxID=1485 RepID=UPI000CF8EAD3|nr:MULTISPECIES: hypothetical protein [Clostridium]AVK49383.1 hypothetical protein AXY43_16025 [Clostridium sp. MF28]PSM58000.1 hypothetical protein C4L39_09285 [Clostridium diolis]
MNKKRLLRFYNDRMRFKLINGIYNSLIILKGLEEGENIYVVHKKEDAKWMNELGFVTTVIDKRTLEFLKNYAKYFRGAKVIILYPKNERELADEIEKKLEEYTCNIMIALLDEIEYI